MKLILALILIVFSCGFTFPLNEKDCCTTKSGFIKTTRWFVMRPVDCGGAMYKALNWPTKTQCPIMAILSGQVIETGINSLLGGYIKVKVDDDKIDSYVIAHISNWMVRTFDRVKEGEVLAITGHSGRTTLKPDSKHGLLYLEAWKDGKKVCITRDFKEYEKFTLIDIPLDGAKEQ